MDNKKTKYFGDGISWENHVIELVTKEKNLFYKYTPNSEIITNIKNYKKEGKLIDCGCHIGRWIEFFQESGYDYTGIDQSEYVINIAKRFHPNGKFINKFLWNINFNEEYDIAFFNAVLQHNTLEEKMKIIPKIYQALKPNGILIITESTVLHPTKTQLTYNGWINLIESFGFKFKKSWHKNELNIDDNYLFLKV